MSTVKVEIVLLVRANSKDELLDRLTLKEGERIVGSLTDADMAVLNSSGFTVIST